MAARPATTWDNLNEAMSYFQTYIDSKEAVGDRYKISIIDLLYVSNFKGGNASITEPAAQLEPKLSAFENALKEIGGRFGGKSLADLTESELADLQQACSKFVHLTSEDGRRIRGFGPSYASALLAAHFLKLIPVLDRRALNGAGINPKTVGRAKQVQDIGQYYPKLISAFWEALRDRRADGTTLRELDKDWFSKPISK